MQLCVNEIEHGTLSTHPRRKPEASREQDDCEEMLSFMETGKNPIDDFGGRLRGKNAMEFGKKWLSAQTNK